eukprot:scaffold8112_cov167-Skeletonema_dohrnii-CCMP3373.AAC.2
MAFSRTSCHHQPICLLTKVRVQGFITFAERKSNMGNISSGMDTDNVGDKIQKNDKKVSWVDVVKNGRRIHVSSHEFQGRRTSKGGAGPWPAAWLTFR